MFTNETIEASAFVVEYRGNICSRGPRPARRGAVLKGFVYKFSWKGERWWYVVCFQSTKTLFIFNLTKVKNLHAVSLCRFFSCSVDASDEDNSLGRLVNDDHVAPNCDVRTVVHEGKPHLCLFASKKISAGEEITFNYGDASYPWRPEVRLKTRAMVLFRR